MTNKETTSPKSKRILFVCGLHRSGTSILFKHLKLHPDISGFENTGVPEDEGQHLQTVFPPASQFRGMGSFGFDRRAYLDESSPLINEANRRKLRKEWERHWDLNKTVLVEKSPPNVIRTRFLQEMFPNSYFLIITRHPVAAGLATRKHFRHSLSRRLRHWLHCHRILKGDLPFLGNVLTIKYEDYVAAPQESIDRIAHFVGLPPAATTIEVNGNTNAKYFEQINQRGLVFRMYRAAVFSRFKSQVEEFGYRLDDFQFRGSSLLDADGITVEGQGDGPPATGKHNE